MKVYLIFFLTLFAISTSAQTKDSMQLANDCLDEKIISTINEYEEKDVDFVLIRTYTSSPNTSQCRFMTRQDSCSRMFALQVLPDYTLGDIYISKVRSSNALNTCIDELEKVKNDLTFDINYMDDNKREGIHFGTLKYTMYGKIDGFYIFEEFDETFINQHHPGLLHYVVCSSLGLRNY